MNKILKSLFIGLALIAVSSLQAQKFGYINSAELLAEVPAVKAADSELETYQAQLVKSGEEMVKKLEAKFQAYSREAQEGLLSQVQMQKKEEELGIEQQKIQKYELEVQNKILAKREELYKPILDKVKVTIENVGKENGYTMIFDTSTGTILHANDGDNVMALVKAKMGM